MKTRISGGPPTEGHQRPNLERPSPYAAETPAARPAGGEHVRDGSSMI